MHSEPLKPGEAELSVVLPREIFDNELNEFWKEVKIIDRILRTIQELCDPNSENITLKTISTTDPILILGVPLAVVMTTLKIIEKILDVYKKTLDIREMKQSAVNKGLSPSLVEAIQAEATETIKRGLDELKADLHERYLAAGRAGKRESELRNAIDRDLDLLAARIDHGVRVEGDVAALPESENKDEPAEQIGKRKMISEVTRITEKIRYFEMAGEPILQLGAPSDGGVELDDVRTKK